MSLSKPSPRTTTPQGHVDGVDTRAAGHWTGNAQDDKHWCDLQIRLEGPAVQPLQTGFAPNWLECTGELVTGATARGNINNWRGRKWVPWDTDTF